jgi:metal-responsive CopG/Arc/MetJ family transcriptional regulator
MRTKQCINVSIDPVLIQALDENRDPTQKLTRSSLVERAVRLFLAIEFEMKRRSKKAPNQKDYALFAISIFTLTPPNLSTD